jgi:RNA polymerase sigma factor (sigma-70 family)
MSDSYLDSREFIHDFIGRRPLAFKALFEAYFERLFAFSFDFTHKDTESEDIAIKCLTKLFEETRRFEVESTKLANILAFLFLITRRASLDYIGSLAGSKGRMTVDIDKVDISSDADIEYAMAKSEVMAALYESLRKLPAKRKMALELLYYEGLSYREAAARMGITIDAFKRYRKDGVSHMRTLISEEHLIPALTAFAVYFFH